MMCFSSTSRKTPAAISLMCTVNLIGVDSGLLGVPKSKHSPAWKLGYVHCSQELPGQRVELVPRGLGSLSALSMTVSCDSALEMRLQKINVFICGANDLGEHVRSSIISQRGALLDCLACDVRNIGKVVQQSADVIHAVHHVQI